VLPRGADPVQLDPATFTTDIDHPYWPMKPGTRWTFLGTDADGDPLDVVLTVTNETKTLANGVTGRVVRDTAIQDGEITQDTVEWYAQDGDGNIWYLGKDTAEFDKALPGVALPANPRPGMTYRREYSAAHAENNGEVVSVTGQVDVPFGHFTDLLTTKDTNALDTSLVEQRLYASGVGPVQIVDLTGGGRLDLFKVDQAPASAGTGPLGSPNP
jgi:hypothetical protein